MNFPVPLQTLWRRNRFNCFNRVLKDLFQSRVNKVGLRLDFTAYPWLEISLESMYERTLRQVNRGHSVKDF
jgi:radical SAM superfamily enzyme